MEVTSGAVTSSSPDVGEGGGPEASDLEPTISESDERDLCASEESSSDGELCTAEF
jgi:hypothetical protein